MFNIKIYNFPGWYDLKHSSEIYDKHHAARKIQILTDLNHGGFNVQLEDKIRKKYVTLFSEEESPGQIRGEVGGGRVPRSESGPGSTGG